MNEPDPINELTAAIERSGTQTKFAAESGLPQSYISAVLRRERPASDRLLTVLGLKRIVVRSEADPAPLRAVDAELSVRTSNVVRKEWGDGLLLRDLVIKTDDELRACGMTRKSIKEIREIGTWL